MYTGRLSKHGLLVAHPSLLHQVLLLCLGLLEHHLLLFHSPLLQQSLCLSLLMLGASQAGGTVRRVHLLRAVVLQHRLLLSLHECLLLLLLLLLKLLQVHLLWYLLGHVSKHRHLDSGIQLLMLGVGTQLVRASSLLKGAAPVILRTQGGRRSAEVLDWTFIKMNRVSRGLCAC